MVAEVGVLGTDDAGEETAFGWDDDVTELVAIVTEPDDTLTADSTPLFAGTSLVSVVTTDVVVVATTPDETPAGEGAGVLTAVSLVTAG